jgi:DNA-binding NarL/FixJ family response regulator
MAQIKQQPPHVFVLDLAFTQQVFEPVSIVRDLRAQYPQMRILILTAYDEPIWIDELLRAGAQGYVVKSDDFSLRLAEAIRTVAQGRTFLSPTAAVALSESRRKYTLTARERAILRLVGQGKSNPGIAAALDIADGTVRNHMSNIYAKLGVNTREAALQAAQNLRELPKPNVHLRHELRTPLHTLLGLVHLLENRLQRSGQLDASSAELFDQITREAERLDGMIDDLTR